MLERICGKCRHSNPLEKTHCASCGHTLQSVALVKRQAKAPMVVGGRKMPAIMIPAPVKKAVGVGVMGVLVNAGIKYLRHRLTQPTNYLTTKSIKQSDTTQLTTPSSTTIIAQRITEKWRRGTLRERIIENVAVQKNEPK